MIIYGLYDRKANCYVQYMPSVSIGAMRRQLEDVVKTEGSQLDKHAEDYDVFDLVTIDDTSGHVTSYSMECGETNIAQPTYCFNCGALR